MMGRAAEIIANPKKLISTGPSSNWKDLDPWFIANQEKLAVPDHHGRAPQVSPW